MVCKNELRVELVLSRELGRLTERFCEMGLEIAGGYLGKRFERWSLDHGEAMGLFSVAMVKDWRKIDVDGNIYGYLIRIAHTRALNLLRGDRRYRKRLERYKELVDFYHGGEYE